MKSGAYFVREVRGAIPDGTAVGALISVESLKKGDVVKATAVSKGKGFQGKCEALECWWRSCCSRI